jgi:hypothetical protein
VEHEKKSSSTLEAGRLPADPHDMTQPEPDPPESVSWLKAGSTPKALVKKQSSMKDESPMHIILNHKISHTAPNMGETTGQLRIPVATLVKQRVMPITY